MIQHNPVQPPVQQNHPAPVQEQPVPEPEINVYSPEPEDVQPAESAEAAAPRQDIPEGAATQPDKPAGARSPEELADIWRDVCQEAAQTKPLLNILYDCVPAEQKGDEIKLIVNLDITKQLVERDAVYINSLLNKYGADGHIVCVADSGSMNMAADAPDLGSQESDLELARLEASELLGIDVLIEE